MAESDKRIADAYAKQREQAKANDKEADKNRPKPK